MLDTTKKTIATLTAAACLGGGSWAIAQSSSGSSTGPQGTQAQGQQGERQRGAMPQQEQVTGAVAQKVTDAVQAKVPGATVQRVEKDPQGYHAHITKSDGTQARVQLDANFAVTSVDTGGGRMGGHRGRGGDRPADVTGDTLSKITAAVTAKLPGAKVDHAHKARTGTGYEAHVVKSDGTRVRVTLDAQFQVTATSADTMRGPGGHGGPGGARAGETPLTGDNAAKARAAALAKLPGATVDRVENDADGGKYEAHVTKADGTRATVKMDADFNVTSVEG